MLRFGCGMNTVPHLCIFTDRVYIHEVNVGALKVSEEPALYTSFHSPLAVAPCSFHNKTAETLQIVAEKETLSKPSKLMFHLSKLNKV